MQDLNDAFKHLRSIHLLFIVTAAAIALALFNSDSQYEKAVEQLRDVVRISDALTADNIAASIAKSSEVAGAEKKLRGFIEESLTEYFEAMEIEFTSIELDSFIADLSAEEEYGHVSNIDPYEYYSFRSEDDAYWFGWELCLLSDGTRHYAHPDDLHLLRATKRTTLGDHADFLDRVVRADRLYVTPTFHPSYLSPDSVISDRYAALTGDQREQLNDMNEIGLDVTLTKVEFTDSVSRGVFLTSQGHAAEDPAGYTDYNFRFDTFSLEIVARSRSTRRGIPSKSVEVNLDFPVMFQPRDAEFVAETLQKASFDKAYYVRYLSRVRSFERLFPELATITTNLNSATPEDLERYLEERARSGGAPLSLLGLQIRRDLIEIWGVLGMLCVHLFFCLHYRVLIRRIPQDSELSIPWIAIYRDPISTIAFQLSIAIPFVVCLIVAFAADASSVLRVLKLVWLIVALGLLGWTEAIYVRFRKRKRASQ